jgi:hypothetical protein
MEPTNNTSAAAVFPQNYLDEMRSVAQNFDRSKPISNPRWNFASASNTDAAESGFLVRMLEYIRPGVYKVEFPALKGASLVSGNTEPDTGAEFITITIVNEVGQVLVSRDMSTATPMVEVQASQQSTPIFSLRLGYQYSLQEARAAMFAQRPLTADKAVAVRGQMERKLDDIIFVGESTIGCKGLLNQSSALTYTTPVGLKGSTSFTLKAPDEVLLDLNAAPSQIVSTSLEIEVPDTAVFPVSVMEYLNGTRVGDGTSSSILTYYKGNTQHIKRIETTYKAETIGASSSRRLTFYKNDPVKLEYFLSQPFEQREPQWDGFMATTLCHMRTAGVVLKYPGSMIYADNV